MSLTQTTKIVVYDLPSENYKIFQQNDLFEKVRNVRVKCVYKLHSLGLQCTESVILVSPSRIHQINEVIAEVEEAYTRLSGEVNVNFLIPVIRVLDLTREQQETFTLLAKRRLVETIDSTINRISELIDCIEEITEETRRRTLRYRLNQLKREWNSILEASRELGIDVFRDLEYLIDLIDDARGRLE